MHDYRTRPEKLQADAAECHLIAADAAKREMGSQCT
jgi:hypothetical protein